MTHQGQSCNAKNFRRISGEKGNSLEGNLYMFEFGLSNPHLCSLSNELSLINITPYSSGKYSFPGATLNSSDQFCMCSCPKSEDI